MQRASIPKAFFINSIHKLSLKLIVMGGKDGNFILYVVQDKRLNPRKTIFIYGEQAGIHVHHLLNVFFVTSLKPWLPTDKNILAHSQEWVSSICIIEIISIMDYLKMYRGLFREWNNQRKKRDLDSFQRKSNPRQENVLIPFGLN